MNNSLPAIVLPFHDPTGLYFPHLVVITPQLKRFFSQAFLSISPKTQQVQAEHIEMLMKDRFFNLNFNEPNSIAGDHYQAAYQNAISSCAAHQILHLCDIDKIAFALQSEHKKQFVTDMKAVNGGNTPLLFQRSQAAWQTYPRHYRDIEHLAIKVGEYLFGKYIDIAWSHLVIQVRQLQKILPHLKRRDFGLLAEILLLLKDTLQTKDVDWLAWEDPFIYARNSQELMKERDNSEEETQKRLRGMKAIMQVLLGTIEP